MPGYRTALGIDISDGRINLALLKKHGDRIKLLKAASCPVPEGAIKRGNIENASVLAKAIKKLQIKNCIHVHPTALSLVANPTLMQVLDLPKDTPGNIRQYVHNEVKHYARLPIKKAAVDFCGIKSLSKTDGRRALAVATDGQKVSAATKVLIKHGLNIEAIEPGWIAYTRACYAKELTGGTNTNMLYATVSNGQLTLSLFRDKTLDFIRVKPLQRSGSQPAEHLKWLAEEIDEILKFYNSGTVNKSDRWQVIIVSDLHSQIVEENSEFLQARFGSVELQIRTPDYTYLDKAVSDEISDHTPTAVAVGLAMGLLSISGHGLNINLVPSEVRTAKSKEKQVLLIVNIAVVLFAIMILCIGFLQAKAEKVHADIRQQKQIQVTDHTQELLQEQIVLEKQITEIQLKLKQINDALGTHSILMWGPVLNDIRTATPKTVRITEFSSRDNSTISLHGQALSYEAVYNFIERLSACQNIVSASLMGSQNDRHPDGLVGYSINCSLNE